MLHKPPALFVGDSPALDFLNTVARPGDELIDWLATGDELLDWLRQAGLLSKVELRTLQANALPGEVEIVAAQARSLRDWFRGFVDAHKGGPLASADLDQLEPLNRLLERDESYKRIIATEEGAQPLQLMSLRAWKSAEAVLQPIGEALARFICEEDFTYVRQCEGQNCSLLFADHTRRRDRRWCSMAICGNRAKQREYRDRKKLAV